MIDGVGGPRIVRADWRRGASSSVSAFSVPSDRTGAAEGAPSTASASAAVMDAILSLQEADPLLERDRKARKHGQSLLAALAGLQRAMMGDGTATSALAQLADLVRDLPRAADPALEAVMSAIRLRAMVELARAGR